MGRDTGRTITVVAFLLQRFKGRYDANDPVV